MGLRLAFCTVVTVVAVAALQAPAAAQGLFDWFGGRQDDRYVRQNPHYQQREESWSGQRQEWYGGRQRPYTRRVSVQADPGPSMQERHGPASMPSIGGVVVRTNVPFGDAPVTIASYV